LSSIFSGSVTARQDIRVTHISFRNLVEIGNPEFDEDEQRFAEKIQRDLGLGVSV